MKIMKGLTWLDFDCGLDGGAYARNFCKPSDCKTCGWGRQEAARRSEYLKQHGLTKCADGLLRLVMPKEGDGA